MRSSFKHSSVTFDSGDVANASRDGWIVSGMTRGVKCTDESEGRVMAELSFELSRPAWKVICRSEGAEGEMERRRRMECVKALLWEGETSGWAPSSSDSSEQVMGRKGEDQVGSPRWVFWMERCLRVGMERRCGRDVVSDKEPKWVATRGTDAM